MAPSQLQTKYPMTLHEKIASELIALERQALDRWGAGDPSGYLEISAPDVTYFDPFQERRVDGLETLTALYESIRGTIHIDRYELMHPTVQLCSDTAILSFRLVSHMGETSMQWNCTEVYRQSAPDWRLIHTHWSLPQR
jgi:ketosteroid isomerase-like protein